MAAQTFRNQDLSCTPAGGAFAVASGTGLSSVLHELKMTERTAWQDTALGGRSSGEAHTALPGGLVR